MMTIGSFVPAVSMVAVAPNPAVAEAYPAVAPNQVVAEAYPDVVEAYPDVVEAYPDADPNPVVGSARRPAYCRSWDKIWFLD
jgi:hypothetical protein